MMTGFHLNCPDDGVLVGVTARVGNWVDQLSPRCRRISFAAGAIGEAFVPVPGTPAGIPAVRS